MIEIDFKKGDGLIPVIIQDAATNEVLDVRLHESDGMGENRGDRKGDLLVKVPEKNLG